MMKKSLLVFVLSLFALTLAGCGNNCDCSKEVENALAEVTVVDENDALDKVTQDCVDKGGTHSLIHSQTAVYGECSFPSGVTCDDDALRADECDYEADTSSIDTEEKRISGCEETAANYIKDIEDGELISVDWEKEEASGASFVRNGTIKYSKRGENRKITVECIADFVDGSISVSEYSPYAQQNDEDEVQEITFDLDEIEE